MRSSLFTRGVIFSSCLLSSCLDFKVDHPPFPIQEHVCDFFDKTNHMQQYWIGISDKTDYPDVKVRIPSEYMGFRLQKFEKAERRDGAILIGARSLDFAPSQAYKGVKDYPDGPIDPARPNYKAAIGSLLLKEPHLIPEGAQYMIAKSSRDRLLFSDIITSGVVSDEHPELLTVENRGVNRRTKDVLIYAPNGEIKIYFKCSKRELVESGRHYDSSCSMYANYPPVSLQLWFDRDFLPEWPELLSKAQTFVDCMILDVENEEGP